MNNLETHIEDYIKTVHNLVKSSNPKTTLPDLYKLLLVKFDHINFINNAIQNIDKRISEIDNPTISPNLISKISEILPSATEKSILAIIQKNKQKEAENSKESEAEDDNNVKRQKLADQFDDIIINGNSKVTIKAIKINDISECKADGSLYYIEKYNQFLIKIDDLIYHGNLPKCIYQNDRSNKQQSFPQTKICAFSNCNKDDCNFFHDKLENVIENNMREFEESKNSIIMNLDLSILNNLFGSTNRRLCQLHSIEEFAKLDSKQIKLEKSDINYVGHVSMMFILLYTFLKEHFKYDE